MSTSRLFIDHNSRDFIQTTTAVKMLQNKGLMSRTIDPLHKWRLNLNNNT